MTEEFLTIILCLSLAYIGGCASRNNGGGWPHIPRWLGLLWYGIGFGLVFGNIIAAAIAVVWAAAWKATGHIPYIFLGRHPEHTAGRAPFLDPIVTFICGPDTPGAYWRNVIGLVVVGIAPSLGPAVLYAWTINPIGGAIILLGGALKPLGYMLGWKVYERGFTALTPNVYGEVLAGAFAWGALGLCF